MRVWTYLIFAEARLEISQRPLNGGDVAWFKETPATGFRNVLKVIVLACLTLAAFLPARRMAV